MNMEDIEVKINEKFQNNNQRKIVVWFDEFQDFIDEIQDIHLKNARLCILNEDNSIYTKYLIEHKYPEENFLIYIPYQRLLDSENFIADIIYYADEFSTDKITNLVQDINIDSSLINIFKRYSKFFNANDRINKFKSLNIDYTEENIILGIIAVITKQDSLNIDDILKNIIVDEIIYEKKVLNQFKKYNVIDDFWKIISDNYGYEKDNPSIKDLMIFLILNYTATFFGSQMPKKWDQYLVPKKNNSRVFIDIFMKDKNSSKNYDKIADMIEEDLDFSKTISRKPIETYIKCDSFRIFDRKILDYYIKSIYSNKSNINLNFLDNRKNTHFYPAFEYEYNLLYWADYFINSFNEFKKDFSSSNVNDIIDQYLQNCVFIDMSYRKFYYYHDKLGDTEHIKNLRKLIEEEYNIFLNEINTDFIKSITQLDSLNNINIDKQWNFFKDNEVEDIKNKLVIIILNDLRYDYALELKNEFNQKPNRKASLNPMLSTIPSYTDLSTVCLLPFKKIEYDNSTLLVDGKHIKNIEEIRSYLEETYSYSSVFTCNEIKNIKRKDLRSKLKNKKLIYVYSNQIYVKGEDDLNEDDVFNLKQESLKEVCEIVKKLRNDMGLGTFYITSNHGFIYKHEQFNQLDNIVLSKEDNLIETNTRFLLTDNQKNTKKTFCIPLEYIGIKDKYVLIPDGIEVFKKENNGLKFINSGVSLEESIVPFLKVKAKRKSKNQRKVELQLLSGNRISNLQTNLTFLQKETVSGDILPLTAILYFVDKDDHKISDEVKISANINSKESEDRKIMVKFTFKDICYSKKEHYYLVMKDSEKKEVFNRIEFKIDILFNK